MSAFREESEEHVVHRLEAFSDIVIGFSLAQMTLNLVLPNDVLDLFRHHSLSLAAFALTFTIVAGLWWGHHRLFTYYFVPTPFNVVLNFLSLGGVMFIVYTLQVWLHAAYHRQIAYAMYAGAIAFVIGINAFLTYRGVMLRGHKMSAEIARRGRARSIRTTIITFAAACVAALNAIPHAPGNLQNWLFIIALAAIGLLVVVRRAPATQD